MDYDNNYSSNNSTIVGGCNYTLGYIFLALFLIVSGVLGYLYFSYDFVSKGDLEKKYILKDDVVFETLPYDIQSNYIEKFICDSQKRSLESKITTLENKSCEPKVITKTIEIEKPVEKIVEKTVTKVVEKPVVAKVDRSHYKTFKCYDMQDVIYPAKSCIDGLRKFLDQNSDAKLFEVIGVYNTHKFNTLEQIKNSKNRSKIDKLTQYAQVGLAYKRVSEAVWSIKQLKKDINLQVVNYTIKEPNDRGFIVRAYK